MKNAKSLRAPNRVSQEHINRINNLLASSNDVSTLKNTSIQLLPDINQREFGGPADYGIGISSHEQVV